MQTIAEEQKQNKFSSTNTFIKRKYKGKSAFAPFITEVQKSQVIETGSPLSAKLKETESNNNVMLQENEEKKETPDSTPVQSKLSIAVLMIR